MRATRFASCSPRPAGTSCREARGGSRGTGCSCGTWPEGPVWIAEDAALYFNDVPENKMHRWSAETGHEMILSPSGGATPEAVLTMREPGANGLIKWPEDGSKLLLADHGARGLSVLDRATFVREVIVSSFEGI